MMISRQEDMKMKAQKSDNAPIKMAKAEKGGYVRYEKVA